MTQKHTNLRHISFSDLRKISKLVSGKKSSGANLLKAGAEERMDTFNFANIELSRAVGLACAGRGVATVLDKLHSEVGEDAMRTLTISTSMVDMLTLIAKTSIEIDEIAIFLAILSTRNSEVESLGGVKAENSNVAASPSVL